MMNKYYEPYSVLYTPDLEPITIISLGEWAWHLIIKEGRVSIPVIRPMKISEFTKEVTYPDPSVVEIYGELIMKKDLRKILLLTKDEELALVMRSKFLPGQQHELQNQKHEVYVSGFFAGLKALG